VRWDSYQYVESESRTGVWKKANFGKEGLRKVAKKSKKKKKKVGAVGRPRVKGEGWCCFVAIEAKKSKEKEGTERRL